MKKTNYSIVLFVILSLVLINCNKNDEPSPDPDPVVIDFTTVEIESFIWGGLNVFYLWKDNVPDLANSRDDDDESFFDLLNSESDPEAFFESLIYNRENVDKWSWIVDDYVALENSFQGIAKTNGVEFRLAYETGSSTDLLGYVRYILPDSDASGKDIKRGDVFDGIDGTQLTLSNYEDLINQDSYTFNMADLNGGNPVSNGKSIALTKSEYQENPVYVNKTFDIGGRKIGYLMYNSFTAAYDQVMNAAFPELKSAGVTDLVLDLRYNGGGSVRTATYLSGMITGQFKGQLLTKEKWNAEIQAWFEENNPDWLDNNFTDEIIKYDTNGNVALREPLNSLNLSELYVIATGSSASASELIINGLNPYINVVTIGTTTQGKYTGSITLYDSDNLTKTGDNLSTNHKWALQPIVLETVNKNGQNARQGFPPTHEEIEYVSEMMELGDVNEPLLAKAISLITGITSRPQDSGKKGLSLKRAFDTNDLKRFGNEMYIDKELPMDFINR